MIYQDAHIIVTNTRFQAGPTMYPIRNLSSVSADEFHEHKVKPADYSVAATLILMALASACVIPRYPWALAIMVPLLAVGAFLGVRAKSYSWTESMYFVMVNTNGAQHRAYWTADRSRRDAILSAIHQAIAGG